MTGGLGNRYQLTPGRPDPRGFDRANLVPRAGCPRAWPMALSRWRTVRPSLHRCRGRPRCHQFPGARGIVDAGKLDQDLEGLVDDRRHPRHHGGVCAFLFLFGEGAGQGLCGYSGDRFDRQRFQPPFSFFGTIFDYELSGRRQLQELSI